MDRRVQIVLHLLKGDLRQALTLDEMARSVNLSPWDLCHLFKAETEMSPLQYLRSLRMQKAKELLEITFLSVKEIMLKVGINDEGHFVRDFKTTYGATPLQYRARHLASLSEKSLEQAPCEESTTMD